MAKINIYVPDELKSKMDLYDRVNWSQVAREAFEKKLVFVQRDWLLWEKAQLSTND